MEAVEKTLTYQEDTGLYRKLLPDDKDKDKCHRETKSDESNYVDLDDLLDMKSDGTKTVKVTFTGEGNQLAVIKCDSGTLSPNDRKVCDNEDKIISEDSAGEHSVSGELPSETVLLIGVPNTNVDFENGNDKLLQTEFDPGDCNENVCSESDELQYTDMYLNSKTESDDTDSASVVLSDHCEPDTVEDESHYITTHEIQLTELDHDVDYDLGRGTWDFEDDNLVYSFVDYASFEGDETREGTLILEGRSQTKVKSSKAQSNITHPRNRGAVVSTEQESDLCDSDKCASSDESMCKNQNGGGNTGGQIHLSIKTSSKALSESNDTNENDNICYRTKHVGDRGHFFFTSTDARAEGLCDRAQYFIPAPGRQHLATKLRGKDVNEYSSGASSSISELDDADKEVRNLTAKSFRSLACPYFDAINLSTSSESSVSEYGLGLNKWSAYMDLKYGNMSQGREKNVIAHKSSSATFEMSKNADGKNRHGKSISSKKAPQTKTHALNKKMTSYQQAPASTKNIELKDPLQPKEGEVITLTETLNFCCNFEAGLPEGARRPKCSKNAHGSRSKEEVTGAAPGAKPGCEVHYQHADAGDGAGDTHNKAIFASSLLKNVISKKMQFEHERKMERGEIRDTHPSHSPCFQCKDQEGMKERSLARGMHRQASETSSGFTANSLDEQCVAGSRSNSCEPTEEQRGNDALDSSPSKEKGPDEKTDACEPPKGQLNRSQNSAFKSWKEGEQEPQKELEIPKALSDSPPPTKENTVEEDLDANSRLTKFSQLFVPSSQLLSKENALSEDPLSSTPAIGAPTGPQIGERELTAGNDTRPIEKEQEAKKPEIMIRLRSVKENKGYSLNIASLLTPKIRFNTINTLKTTGDTKCHVLVPQIPHFTVRDIRENKYKFQPPIYHVRDVRKLVKSSYRFVSLDNNDNKGPTAPSATVDKVQGKLLLPAPIVIKCHSVKTNCNVKQPGAVTEVSSQKQTETDRSSPQISRETSKCETASSHWIGGRAAPVLARQFHPDRSELQLNIESKLTKQRQERLTGDSGEWKSEPKVPKQAALEKLRAAVKTMEQLYVFDRNEWKRKTQAPRPVTDSHVLSLIAREEQGAEEMGSGSMRLNDSETNTGRFSQTLVNTSRSEISKAQQDKGSVKIIHVPYNEDTFKTHSQQSKTFSNKSVLHFGNKTPVNISSLSDDIPQSSSLSQTLSMKSSVSKTPVAPLSLKITPPKCGQVDQGKVKRSPTSTPATVGNSDSENYLTIPGGGSYASEIKLPNRDLALPNILSSQGNSNVSQTNTGDTKRPERSDKPTKRSPFITETQSPEHPTTTIYHHPVPAAVQGPQPPVFRFPPSVPTLSPSPSAGEPFPQIHRKMLLDPTTGHYYLVDTPLQATTKRLFDPETGQYVDVPMPHSPGKPVTPVPMSVSPLALNPGAYAPTYMIYPGFIPSPTLAAQVVPPQAMCQPGPGDASREQGKHARRLVQEANMTSAETPYYSATGDATQAPQRLPVTVGHVTTRGSGATSERKPVISITAPQGPRIIAPPSFDGTTMSFVVEHR